MMITGPCELPSYGLFVERRHSLRCVVRRAIERLVTSLNRCHYLFAPLTENEKNNKELIFKVKRTPILHYIV